MVIKISVIRDFSESYKAQNLVIIIIQWQQSGH